MVKTSILDIKTELVVFLRNSDIISTSDRGVTTKTDTGTFTSESTYTLSTSPTLVKNVRSVTVASVPLSFGTDYTVNYTNGVISFTSAKTGAYSIVYDYGATDRIFPDFPQPYLTLNKFPRIAVDIISGTTNEFGIGSSPTQSEYIISIVAYDSDQEDVETMIASIRSTMLDNKKNFYYIPFLTITSMGPLLNTPFGQNKIFQRNQDMMARFIFEE
jgi:hypothetical protein